MKLNPESWMANIIHRIVLVLIISCACFILQAQENEKQPLRVGLIADIQYADKDVAYGTRFYRASIPKLKESVKVLNERDVDFTVVLGDFVDEGPKDLLPVLTELDALVNPVYNLLGNHDFEAVKKPYDLYKRFGMEAPYYVVDTAGWRFILLNTNELSGYATMPNTALAKEYQRMLSALETQNRSHIRPWNGGVGKKQMKWLKKKLNEARKRKLSVLVFTHHPLWPEHDVALNNRELLALLSKHKQVKAVISGHNHKGSFGIFDGLPCITLEGMVETADQNAFGVLTLSANKLTISGMGRMTSRAIDF